MRLSDLQSKKIVSILTGRNMGTIIDCEVNLDGKIDSLIIEQGRAIFSLSKDSDTNISWSDITKIGEDVILVKKE